MKTKAEADIERRISENTDDTTRRAILERARVFKTSWIDLGEALSLIARNQEYKAWGYKSLIEYCQKELHIREATVYKLVGNFDFLSSHEPTLMESENIVRLPDPDSLRVLAKARSDQKIDETAYASLRENALTHGQTAATLHKKLSSSLAEKEDPEYDPSAADLADLRRRILNLIAGIRTLIKKMGGGNPSKIAPGKIESALACLEDFADTDTPGQAKKSDKGISK